MCNLTRDIGFQQHLKRKMVLFFFISVEKERVMVSQVMKVTQWLWQRNLERECFLLSTGIMENLSHLMI